MKILVAITLLLPLGVVAQEAPVRLTVDTTHYHDLSLKSLSDNTYDMVTSGKDPYLFTRPLEADINENNTTFSFEYFCPTGLDFIQLFFYPLQEGREPKTVRDIGSTEGWVEFKIDVADELESWGKKGDYLRIDLGEAPDLKIQIRNLTLRPLTAREEQLQAQKDLTKQREAVLETNLKEYLSSDFETQITSVLVTEKQIKVKGTMSGHEDFYLAEVSPYEHATELTNFEFLIPIKAKGNAFAVAIDRFVKRHGFTQDRVLSKWMIVQGEADRYQPVSHSRYPDSIIPKYTYPYVQPDNKKGLGGYSANREAPVSDLDDLGITSVTVNIWITHFFRSGPSPDNMPFEYMGKTYYVDKDMIHRYDSTLLTTARKDIEVSAILLVDKASKAKDPEIGRILQHPDCDPAGIYSMPNVTTPQGVQYYAAVLDFLAARYSRLDKKYGRIHHWIIHNEVDAGWVWTNAGDKTALVFMDLYYKSMRMSYNIARTYNPHAKVFISLTHYWNWTSNPHFYHSRELLEQLLQFSKTEGDFEWAIAHHPYPEDLREPKTWLDEKVSFNFDTKLITFKNIEVLNAWVQQPEVLYQGKHKRTVYLSENGTNSPTYSQQDLKEQAAGMAYAWKKMEPLKGIDGFQYHNWQDNRGEGGLRIGLRRFPDDQEDPGGTKPIWYVYQAAGTDKEDEVFDQYKKVIGIQDWDEIRYRGTIGYPKKKVAEETSKATPG